ncbi:hypothetical protein [Rhodococcus sp. SGAir0479]|uniref:hypothetical protein n=1 Tax=Rhodococcus sp. SGAir0479 TaxID=2567884 RepID=UPI0010CD1BA4|nr:hypothetical protein [Rhodococcus sp. SGAir0479]QCQ91373.1 hypothetical protein E7742_09065 [Rhodococcus sp. SGAir0479]
MRTQTPESCASTGAVPGMTRRDPSAPSPDPDDEESDDADVRYPQPSPLDPWWRRVMDAGSSSGDDPAAPGPDA